tara:strand:- start:51298 stop:52263 length:966 start_codon:yes stop_codon:yes gene_type:complete
MKNNPKNFALIGAAGFVAPRHLKAIQDTGNRLIAAVDPHDSVGILDSYFPEARFFTEIERFDRFLEKRRHSDSANSVDYVSICSPNYLHDAHTRLAFRVKAHAICEKPLVINPWNLQQLEELEQEHQRKVFTVLQLRLHPRLLELKRVLQQESPFQRKDICLSYVTRRGFWYHNSWKGSEEKSGGLVMNIGIHFFDILLWLFGQMERIHVHRSSKTKMAGCLELERARVRWLLSIDPDDVPEEIRNRGGYAYRSLTMDGEEIDLSHDFTDLHTEVYRDILSGGGFGIQDAASAIDLVYAIRNTVVTPEKGLQHPALNSLRS